VPVLSSFTSPLSRIFCSKSKYCCN
jgi:hypothetical protein